MALRPNRHHPNRWRASAGAALAVVAAGTAAHAGAVPAGTATDAAVVTAVVAGTAGAGGAGGAVVAAAVHLRSRPSCFCRVHLSQTVEHPHCSEPHRQLRGRVPSRSSAPAPSFTSPRTR